MFAPFTSDQIAKDTGRYEERERCKRVIRKMIHDAREEDPGPGRCCLARMEEILAAISDAGRQG